MRLKDFILKKNYSYNFKLVKVPPLSELFLSSLKKDILKYNLYIRKFKEGLSGLQFKELGNFLFMLRILDFRRWEFEKNWQLKEKNNFWGLLERTKILFKNWRKLNFEKFKKIFSPKESLSLAKLRYQILRESFGWLKKEYKDNFDNYFEQNKTPLSFCQNLFSLRKFRDFSDGFYFLKPNQLLYYEYILGKGLMKKYEENLKQLTVFSEYKICELFLNFDLIELKTADLEKIKKGVVLKENSLLVRELRWATIILGEEISQKLKIPAFKIDTILWNLAEKHKFKIPAPRIKSIFY